MFLSGGRYAVDHTPLSSTTGITHVPLCALRVSRMVICTRSKSYAVVRVKLRQPRVYHYLVTRDVHLDRFGVATPGC